MANVAVIGAQWGDEGKGKIVDWLSERAEVVVRFQGGHNAGHTLVIGNQTYKLALLPSGVVRKGKLSIIGNGVVVDPWHFLEEVKKVTSQGVSVTPETLKIANHAVLILPLHRDLDGWREDVPGTIKIGTTRRGIGPAYEDKVARRSIRVADLMYPSELPEKVRAAVDYHNFVLTHWLKADAVDFAQVLDDALAFAEYLRPMIDDVSTLLYDARRNGDNILFEGAQGALLDIDHGTYPYVTSSNTTVGGALAGTGVGACDIDYVLGICKAYATRVGGGPFPTELNDDMGETLRKRGNEFGASTGRPRRCGWIDLVALKRATQINAINGLAITKLDVLDGLPSIKVCIAYEYRGKRRELAPLDADGWAECKPVYLEFPGWEEPTSGVRDWNKLPAAARAYLRAVEELSGCHLALVATGADRDDTIVLRDPFG